MIESLKRNRVFKFLASLRMAVILMIALAVIVSVATVIESRYNAQIAGILVYKSTWFAALTTLLWINIFCSTLMRVPFKVSHAGFVITHVGLLLLLAGGLVTGELGVDGQLRIVEGQSSNIVGLPELSFKVASAKSNILQSYRLKRSLDVKTGDQLGLGDLREKTGLIVDKYLPFVVREQGYADQPGEDGAPAINFSLESSMFGTASEWLHAKDRPQGQMGPAILELMIEDTSKPAPAPKKKSKQAAAPDAGAPAFMRSLASAGTVLIVRDQSGAELGTLKVAELRKGARKIKNFKISLLKEFEQASVVDNKLVERGGKGANPALELKIESGDKSVREVAFAKYPDFSMGQSASLGLKLEYRVAGTETQDVGSMPDGHPSVNTSAEAASADPAQNRIEFRVPASELRNAASGSELPLKVVLYRNGKQVFERAVKVGETIETPWMGMKIKLDSVMRNAVAVDQVRPTEMRPRSNVPDSAVLIRHSSEDPSKAIWVVEGDFKTVGSGDQAHEVYYGMETVELPFTIQLEKFEKVDYPGTETPMSFQSTIRVNGAGEPILISMNEPLKQAGYTLYQSSYEMGRGMPTASIFSVNRDPGRIWKYLGSLILCIGIAVFAIMRSRWYNGYRQRRLMKTQMAVVLLAVLSMTAAPSMSWAETGGMPAADPHAGHNHGPGEHASHDHASAQLTPAQAKERFTTFGKRIDSNVIAELPIQSHGRLKPLDSYAREAVLYLTGKYRYGGLDAIQLYLGLMMSEAAEDFEIVNLRDPQLRTKLGFTSKQRHVSLRALQGSQLEALAQPALQRQERDSKSLNPEEKALVEVMQQVWLARGIISGGHLMQGLQPRGEGESPATAPVIEKLQSYFRALVQGEPGVQGFAAEAIAVARAQPYPELIRRNLDRMGLEVWYNKAHMFFWVAVAYFLIGLALLIPMTRRRLAKKGVLLAVALPFIAHSAGFAIRVVITGFAPVTNMYGTMIWVAFGVVLFGILLYLLYKHDIVFGIVMLGAALTLFITENLPLVLSPDMDPIVAVLRSNFWLSTHVLTITISYAGFTIAMLLGNVAIVRRILSAFRSDGAEAADKDQKFYKEYGHLAYRVIQLGVFFLTTGIILGGVWADYSWGRFWGWDPKETWSLIANLGYLSILHAKHVGWLKGFGILAAAPVAYLLVVMAWYGVNFILAAGLHSYGFSSGGAAAVGGFVLAQLILLSVAGAVHHMKSRAMIQKAGV